MNNEIEMSLVGYLLLSDTLEKQKSLTDLLLPEFFTDINQNIVKEIKDANSSGRTKQIGSLNYDRDHLLTCISKTSLFYSANEMLLSLKELYLTREFKNLVNLKDLDIAKAKILDIEEKAQILDCMKPQTIQEVIVNNIEQSTHDLENLPKTGFKDFDEEFMGFMDGQVCTIGGYSGIGKSTFIFSLVKTIARKYETLIFNLEMDNFTMSSRILSSLSGVPFPYCLSLGNPKIQEQIDKYKLRQSLNHGMEELDKLSLSMVDDQFSLSQILNSIRKKANDKKLKFVLIDYLQLISTNSNKQRHLEIGQITRELKILAKELKITIILLAQLGRASLGRDEPEIQDLRESGSIEMDSDLVFLIFKKDKDRWLKLAKDRMFGKFHRAKLNYNSKTQSYE